MADAGAGSGWDAFEIALVVLLAAGLLMRLTTGQPLFPTDPAPTTKETSISAPTPADTCGLSIMRPHSLEKVQSFVTLAGSTTGCQWPSTQTVALYAQIIDAKGVPVSAYSTIPPTGVEGETTSFNTTVVLTTTPKTKTGYLILVPTQPIPGSRSISVRIPITFIK